MDEYQQLVLQNEMHYFLILNLSCSSDVTCAGSTWMQGGSAAPRPRDSLFWGCVTLILHYWWKFTSSEGAPDFIPSLCIFSRSCE